MPVNDSKWVRGGTTITIGIVVSLIVFLLAHALLPEDVWVFARFDLTVAVALAVTTFLGGLRQIPVGSFAALLILGKRVGKLGDPKAGIILHEGYQWTGPLRFLADLRIADFRLKEMRLDLLNVFCKSDETPKSGEPNKSGPEITFGEASIFWAVEDPNLFFSIDESVVKSGLDDVFDATIREDAIDKTLDQVLLTIPAIKKTVLEQAQAAAQEWGINVSRLAIPSIKPSDPDLIKDLSLRRREAAQRDGEIVEIDHVRARISELMSPPWNFSKEQALEVVQTERKKVTKEVKETKISIADRTLDGIGDIVKAFKP